MVKQISVFVENRPGRLHDITELLSKNNINIRALSIADTTDFGILRLIVDRPDEAEKLLRDAGQTVKCTQVIAIEIPDTPGGLSGALAHVRKAGVVIEYMYAFVGACSDNAMVILRLNEMERGIAALEKGEIKVLTAEQVYAL